MYITNEAKQLLEEVLIEKGVEGIRLYTTEGSYGPQIALALDSPQEFDRVQMINGIKVAFDPSVTGTDELTLDKEVNEEGTGLVLIGASNYC